MYGQGGDVFWVQPHTTTSTAERFEYHPCLQKAMLLLTFSTTYSRKCEKHSSDLLGDKPRRPVLVQEAMAWPTSRRPSVYDLEDFMRAFIRVAYDIMTVLYEFVPAFKDTWVECLGDLARYQMAIEQDTRDREIWGTTAREW